MLCARSPRSCLPITWASLPGSPSAALTAGTISLYGCTCSSWWPTPPSSRCWLVGPISATKTKTSPDTASEDRMHSNKVPIHERAFSVGDIIGVNAYRIKLDALKQRLREGGYHIRETPHFLVCRRPASPVLLVHWFPQVAVDGNLGHYLMEELQPLGMLANPQRYGD